MALIKTKVDVARPEGETVTVDGYRTDIAGLAVHKAPAPLKGWHVTHIGSGYHLFTTETRKEAVAVLADVSRDGWEREAAEITADKEMRNHVVRLRQKIIQGQYRS